MNILKGIAVVVVDAQSGTAAEGGVTFAAVQTALPLSREHQSETSGFCAAVGVCWGAVTP